jgi:hypothetical protein
MVLAHQCTPTRALYQKFFEHRERHDERHDAGSALFDLWYDIRA